MENNFTVNISHQNTWNLKNVKFLTRKGKEGNNKEPVLHSFQEKFTNITRIDFATMSLYIKRVDPKT